MWMLGITVLVGMCLFLMGTWFWGEFQTIENQNTQRVQSVAICGTILAFGGGLMLSLY